MDIRHMEEMDGWVLPSNQLLEPAGAPSYLRRLGPAWLLGADCFLK